MQLTILIAKQAFEEDTILGVFSSLEKAETALAEYLEDSPGVYFDDIVYEGITMDQLQCIKY